MRVGILGGTFDPVHIAHLILAQEALRALRFDEVLFIPAGQPWRKSDRQITPAEHRLAMLRLAVEDNPAFGISDIELRREGPSYTADTLEALAGERLDDEFVLILGADALADLPNWNDPERILRHATIAVAPRDGAEFAIPRVEGLANRVVRFSMPRIEISSTEIRARAAAGESVRYLTPDGVARYIEEHALYR